MNNIEYRLTKNNRPLEIEMFDGIISCMYAPITPKRRDDKKEITYVSGESSERYSFQVYKKGNNLVLAGEIPIWFKEEFNKYNIKLNKLKLNLTDEHHVK